MPQSASTRQTVLIVDDSALNRAMLADIIDEDYDILEAADGEEAVKLLHLREGEISLVLLDIVMPVMDGFEVLAIMNKYGWIKDVPVIMVSAESASQYAARAYDLGVTDFINRPYDVNIVRHRVANTLMLYAKQRQLIGMVADQIYEREKNNDLMVAILSHIVEFRNGESGLHVLHVSTLTEFLLEKLSRDYEEYSLTSDEISLAATASSLHDIGKISIPEEVLNKPGRFTDEEFELMKQHTTIGSDMLDDLPFGDDVELIDVARKIVRWHHERWDGRGYPDGLKGDEIPIVAQVVALADVYDALTSKRVYKDAYSHEKAVQMILDGECGAFNPLLLEAFAKYADEIEEAMHVDVLDDQTEHEVESIVRAVSTSSELTDSGRTVQLFEYERMKHQFFASMSNELQYEYTIDPPMLVLSDFGARKLDIDEVTVDPDHNPKVQALFGQEGVRRMARLLRSSTPEDPVRNLDMLINIKGEERWMHLVARAIWSEDEPPIYKGSLGKFIDIHEERMKERELQWEAEHDSLTGLYNHATAKVIATGRLEQEPDQTFGLLVVDVDKFKEVNDTQGHLEGDRILQDLAERLARSVRGHDLVARVGGDEFLIFVECTPKEIGPIVKRIFETGGAHRRAGDPTISIGVALTSGDDRDYTSLFQKADAALYIAKDAGRDTFHVYEEGESMPVDLPSAVGPIDEPQPEEEFEYVIDGEREPSGARP